MRRAFGHGVRVIAVLLPLGAPLARASDALRTTVGDTIPPFGTLGATGRATPGPGITLTSPMTVDPRNPGRVAERPAAPGGDLAFGAFQRGYFATALTEAMRRLKADPKDGAAMALIGEIYSQGLAVKVNAAEAARWNRLAGDQGNREGLFAYAMALLQGQGVPADRAAGRTLLEKAAALGHPGAFYNLGVMALSGRDGRPADFGLAAVDFRKAADGGDIDALYALATLTENGRGVPQDLPKAAELMRQAAEARHAGAAVEYAIMLFNGKGVAKDEAAAARYFQKAAWVGNPIAENRLARLYAAGRGVAKDGVEAARWHILARAAGIADPWLDDQLALLSPPDRTRVEEIVRRQLGP